MFNLKNGGGVNWVLKGMIAECLISFFGWVGELVFGLVLNG